VGGRIDEGRISHSVVAITITIMTLQSMDSAITITMRNVPGSTPSSTATLGGGGDDGDGDGNRNENEAALVRFVR